MRDAAVGFHCPECVAEGRRTVRKPRTAFGGSHAGQHGYVTRSLVGINVAVTLLSLVVAGSNQIGTALQGAATPLHFWGAVIGLARIGESGPVIGIATGEYWRLLTAMFLHYGLVHLLVNMWALWVLGRYLEQALGPIRFLTLYLIAGLGGSVAAYMFQPQSLTAGASGAIFGLFATLFVINRRLGLDNRGVIFLIVINLSMVLFVPRISLVGHLGGLIIGGLVAFGFAYAPRGQRTAVQVATSVVVTVLLVVVAVLRTGLLSG